MRTTLLASTTFAAVLAAASCGLVTASPASAQARPAQVGAAPSEAAQAPIPDPSEAGEDEEGGSGYLPGARFQRKLDGGPGFVCTATNALHTDQCTASCRKGQTAECTDAEGSAAPSCDCTGG